MAKQKWEKRFCERCGEEKTHLIKDDSARCWSCVAKDCAKNRKDWNESYMAENFPKEKIVPKIMKRLGNPENLQDEFKCKISNLGNNFFFETEITEDEFNSYSKDNSKRLATDFQRGYFIDNPIKSISLNGSLGFDSVTMDFEGFGHIHLNKERFLALKESMDWICENMEKSSWNQEKHKGSTNKELDELKKDMELLKLSIITTSGINMSLKDFESEKYDYGTYCEFQNYWEQLKEKAKDLKLI